MTAPAFTVAAEIGALFDVSSSPHSFGYPYAEVESYTDNSVSEMQSPLTSRYHVSLSSDLGLANMLPSPTVSTESEDKTTADATKPAAKRKRENRYKNAPPAVLSRRRAQNRASQRAYRERKDQRIRELEALLDEARQKNDALNQAYAALQAAYKSLSMNSSPQLGRPAQTQMAFVPAPPTTRPLDGLGVEVYSVPGLGAYPM